MERPLTHQERQWLLWGLATLAHEGPWAGGGSRRAPLDPQSWLDQLDGLLVVRECECGSPDCHTVTFQHCRRGGQQTLVASSTDDGRMLVITIDRDSSMLAELEII